MPIATLQTLDVEGVRALLERAAREGWNPGSGDAAAFHRADPHGFLARFVDGRFAAGISVVRQDARHAFLGLYIADPACRGQGHGMALWSAALEAFDRITVGLDGVVEQQSNYAGSGFAPLHRNVRWLGRVASSAWVRAIDRVLHDACEISLREPRSADIEALVTLDARIGGLTRRRFIECWCLHGAEDDRRTLLAERDGSPVGMGTIRRCTDAHKIGPLIAEDAQVAGSLLDALARQAGASEVMLDVPEPNRAAVGLVRDAGLAPVFQTARMYRGAPPSIDTARLFGVATLELG